MRAARAHACEALQRVSVPGLLCKVGPWRPGPESRSLRLEEASLLLLLLARRPALPPKGPLGLLGPSHPQAPLAQICLCPPPPSAISPAALTRVPAPIQLPASSVNVAAPRKLLGLGSFCTCGGNIPASSGCHRTIGAKHGGVTARGLEGGKGE